MQEVVHDEGFREAASQGSCPAAAQEAAEDDALHLRIDVTQTSMP